MKKRDRRLTPTSASIAAGWSDAVPESTGTTVKSCITASAFYLKGEGTSKNKEEDKKSESGNKDKYNEIISKQKSYSSNPKNVVTVFGPDNKMLKNTSESKATKWCKEEKATWLEDKTGKNRKAIQLVKPPIGKIRVPVVNPDNTPAMPTNSRRAREWIEIGKAIPKRTKTGIFYVQLVNEPSGRNKQQIVATLDPGSRFSGIGVCSKKSVLYTCNLELIADEKKNSFASIKNRMDKRRELRRGRRHRNCRRRPARFDNRTKTGKLSPSIRSRKQLELKVITDLCKIYPISIIGLEDVSFNHYTKRRGKNFSQLEVGKKWEYEELKKIPNINEVRLIKGYDTSVR